MQCTECGTRSKQRTYHRAYRLAGGNYRRAPWTVDTTVCDRCVREAEAYASAAATAGRAPSAHWGNRLSLGRLLKIARTELGIQTEPESERAPMTENRELTCPHHDCDEVLILEWQQSYPLTTYDLTDSTRPLSPFDAYVKSWNVGCLAGHVILLPDTRLGCPCKIDDQGGKDCPHIPELYDWHEEYREFRAGDHDRLRRTIEAISNSVDHVTIVERVKALLDEWNRVGKGDGVHGEKLRRAIEES